jgi:antitoxin YefM
MAYLLPGRLWRQEQVEQVIAGVRQKNIVLKYIVLDTVLLIVHDTVHMTAMTYTAARENLASTMDRVCVDHDPVIITRNRDQAVVMLSLDDYESLQETAYLLRTPANAKRLIASIESLNSGKTLKKNVKDLAEA